MRNAQVESHLGILLFGIKSHIDKRFQPNKVSMGYSPTQLRQLARDKPIEFIQHFSGLSNISLLVIAIDILGEEIGEEELVIPIFKRLLKHVHMQVREAALSAILSFYGSRKSNREIYSKIEEISKNDPSHDIRDYAKDILKDLK